MRFMKSILIKAFWKPSNATDMILVVAAIVSFSYMLMEEVNNKVSTHINSVAHEQIYNK